jgi:EAL domain-containing protein (putative c-di-GMP-specific phosphodiesterase class I)
VLANLTSGSSPERIETAAQAASLREIGCDLGQGYYYARPSPAKGISFLMDAHLPAPILPVA